MDDTSIDIIAIETDVRREKSGSSAKGYLAALGYLRKFVGSDTIPLSAVTADFMERYGNFLLENDKTFTTVNFYQRCVRAAIRRAVGKENHASLKHAFLAVKSSNETAIRTISADEVFSVASASLDEYRSLAKIRDVFMFGTYNCGLLLDGIKASIKDPGDLPQIKNLISSFEIANGQPIASYVNSLSDESYEKGLAMLGSVIGLTHKLIPSMAKDAWIAVARVSAVEPEVMLAAAAPDITFSASRSVAGVGQRAIRRAIIKVADRINDLSFKWFAMQCISKPVSEINESLKMSDRQSPDTVVDTFVPVPDSTETHKRVSRGPMSRILFFRTTTASAISLKERFSKDARVFCFRSGSRRPAPIPDADMMMFMFLNDVASDSICYYFPDKAADEQLFTPSDMVTITSGSFTGHVGVIDRLSADRLKVVVRIEAMNGIVITAELPKQFLKHQ